MTIALAPANPITYAEVGMLCGWAACHSCRNSLTAPLPHAFAMLARQDMASTGAHCGTDVPGAVDVTTVEGHVPVHWLAEDQRTAVLRKVYAEADRHDRRSNEWVGWMAARRSLYYEAIHPDRLDAA